MSQEPNTKKRKGRPVVYGDLEEKKAAATKSKQKARTNSVQLSIAKALKPSFERYKKKCGLKQNTAALARLLALAGFSASIMSGSGEDEYQRMRVKRMMKTPRPLLTTS